MVLGKWNNHMQRNETASLSYAYTKINWKWTKDVKIKSETIKLLRKSIDSQLLDTGFLDLTPKAKVTKAKTGGTTSNWKASFCMAKEIINKMKRQPIQRKKILANHVFDKGLMSRYEKNFVNSIAKKKKSNLKMDRGSE